MPLSYEDRVELLKKARQAKKEKMMASKAPVSAPVNEDSDSSEEAFEEPTKPVKTKTLPPKWLKNPEKPKKVIADGVMTKEQPLIEDEPETPSGHKKRAMRKKEPVKTLEIIAEPKAIEEVMDEVVNNDTKYKPKPKATPKPKANPVTITKCPTGMCLFDY